MISVIIPVYNVYHYIDHCLRSVVGQTWAEFEILLIDDGSTDGSDKKCREWAKRDARIHLYRTENRGLGSARNLGVELAMYDYITFLDSDDWWDRHFLERMLAPILEADPDIVCCDIHYWEKDEKGNISDAISKLRIEPEKKLYIAENRELINTARTYMWGKVYKKKLFTENKILQPAHVYEDVASTPVALVKAETIYRAALPLYYYYRKREGSLANQAAGLGDMERSLWELILRFKKECLFEAYKKPLKRLVYSQARFIIRKAQVLCGDKQRSEIEASLFEMLTGTFPELKNIWRASFFVSGRAGLRQAVQMIALDEAQIHDVGELKKQEPDSAPEWNLVSEIPDAASQAAFLMEQGVGLKRIILIADKEASQQGYDKRPFPCPYSGLESRIVRINIEFHLKEADEGQLWDLADKIFYEL